MNAQARAISRNIREAGRRYYASPRQGVSRRFRRAMGRAARGLELFGFSMAEAWRRAASAIARAVARVGAAS